jgi:alkylation response protein AidB-like acyl-CoA dehydrogenase
LNPDWRCHLPHATIAAATGDAAMAEQAVSSMQGAARKLEPLIAASRARFDQERELPRELVNALGEAGFFRMWLPRKLGGMELPPLPFLEAIEELARLDGSVGWCTVIPAGYGRLAGALSEQAAREVFLTGSGILVGTLNPTGKAIAAPGGYRVSGRWGYGSFIGHSDWVLGNCITHDDAVPRTDPAGGPQGGPEFRLCLFRRKDVEVADVWHVGGLRGTGSNDYAVRDLFVPEEHTVPLPGFMPAPREPGPLYAVPMTSTFVSCIAMVVLGIARAAIEALVEIAAAKTPTGSRSVLRERPLAQADMARAESLVRSGRAFLFNELGALWEDALAGRKASVRGRALVRLAACQATQCAIQAVDLAYALGGGTSLYEGNRLERCFRDAHAAGQHVAVAPQSNLEPVGRVLLGLDPGMTRF